MRYGLGTLLLALALATSPRATGAQSSSDRDSVVATVQRLFDGMRRRDTALIRSVLDSGAHLISVPSAPTRRARPLTASQFIAQIAATAPGAAPDERIFDPEVRIDGVVAQVWTYYTFRQGTTFSHCGTDAASLMRVGGTWKIVSLIWSSRREGCSRTE